MDPTPIMSNASRIAVKAVHLARVLAERAVQPALGSVLAMQESRARFAAASGDYGHVLEQIANGLSTRKDHNAGYAWIDWVQEIRAACTPRVPEDFLAVPAIASTMVLGRRGGGHLAAQRIALVADVFGTHLARTLLVEDAVGSPILTSRKWLTSANRAHHAAHLASYRRLQGSNFWEADDFVEWGGGYGNMARLVRRMNPRATYTIVDLPELLALQYVYLSVVEGARPHVLGPGDSVRPGQVNLVASALVVDGSVSPTCDAFVSTWALNESPLEAQQVAIEQRLFGASKVLLAYREDDGNCLAELSLALNKYPVPFLPRNAYAFM